MWVSFSHPPPLFLSLCDDRWCVGEKLNISSEIGFLWRNWWITLCSWREFKRDCLCRADKCMNTHTHTYTPIHICKGERTRGLFMLKQNEFLWVVDCYLWGNTLLSHEKCNLDCSMTNNELLGFFLEATAAAAFLSPSISSAYAQTLEHTRHNSPALMSLLLNGLTHPVNQTNSHKNID